MREKAGDNIGNYRLLENIGEGAFGVVWMAEQETPLRRRVALKIIKLGMDTRAVIARFEAERQALALMDHPNIARVFDGGATPSGRPYFVMELVRGMPLTEYCDTHRLNTRERLELSVVVCQAVQHAHQKGIIHRDLKPSNVLVMERDGHRIPKVIDFGIAKATEQRLTDKTLFTQFNQFIGTPQYMSPEQAGFGGQDIDTRTDVYSLGALLYELITGQTPFNPKQLHNAGVDAVKRLIQETDPPKPSTRLGTLELGQLTALAARRKEPPETLTRRVRGELDWIVLKALEKDRSRRYQSASGLAGDLQNYLTDQPVSAAPPTVGYRAVKFARRNRAAIATVMAFVLLLILGTVISAWLAIRATIHSQREKEARFHEQTALRQATNSLFEARLNAYATDMNLAQQARAENNQARALELLERHHPKAGEPDLRGFEWRYLWQLTRSNEKASFKDSSQAVAFSPDGKLLAEAAQQVIIRQTTSYSIVTNLDTSALSLAFSPDARILAAANTNVDLWSTENWTRLRPPLPQAVQPVRFSPDGKWLITGAASRRGEPQKHLLWRTDTWEVIASCLATPQLGWQLRNAVAFSPDGTLLVTPWLQSADDACWLKLWKVPTLELVENISPKELSSWSAAFLSDTTLLIGTFYGELFVWDIPKRQIVQTIRENRSGINTISVASRANVFATASHDHRVTLWDGATFKILARYRGHTQTIWASAISPDGAVIATGGFDGRTKLWDGREREADAGLEDGSLIAGFSADSRKIVLAPQENRYQWHVYDSAHRVIEVPPDPPLRWDFINRPYDVYGSRPVGALGRPDGSVELWDLQEGKKTASWPASSNIITSTKFTPDGAAIAVGDSTGMIKIWSVTSNEELATFRLASDPKLKLPVSTIALSRDGKLMAAGSWPSDSDKIVVWNISSKTEMLKLSGLGGSVTTVAFSPDGSLLAGGAMGPSQVSLWDIPSGKPLPSLKGHVTGIVEVAFSPDGKTLATGGYDTVKLWNIATKQEVASLPFRGTLRGVSFSPDGNTLAVSYLLYPGHRVRLYRAPGFSDITTATH